MAAASAAGAMARGLRGATFAAARQGVWQRCVCAAPAQARCLSSLTVESLRAPVYEKVPIIQEDPSVVLAEMPSLVLGGAPPVRSTSSKVAGISLDQPIVVEESSSPSAGTSAASSWGMTMPETRFGELSNGVRIAAVDRKGMCASVGLFVHTGSRYEKAESACIPHALELMAFRSSAHLTHLRTLKTLEQLGAAASCRVGREDILYQFDALREYVPVVLPLMLANVLCPSILEEEIQAARDTAVEMRQGLEENTEGLLCELLHVAAYKGNTLGHSLYAEEEDVSKFTIENLNAYIRRACRPERLIVVGVNVGFEDLCKWTARSFAEFDGLTQAQKQLPAIEPPEQAVYTGGDFRLERPNPLCHLMLGWEVEGGWNGTMLAAVTVLQMFLGGGGSFSTGGPGKGMHTRLYTAVLNRHHWVESCQASSVMYADSGLFTIYATLVPQYAGDFVGVIARIFKGLTQISPDELQRAKNALKSSIHMNLEMRAVMMEDIGRQLILSGKVGTTQEFGSMVDAVTVEDLLNVLRSCLKTEPTVVAFGAVEKVPVYEQIKKVMQQSCP